MWLYFSLVYLVFRNIQNNTEARGTVRLEFPIKYSNFGRSNTCLDGAILFCINFAACFT